MTWWTQQNITNKYDAIIADGAIRSGKTLSMSVSFILWAMNTFNNYSFGICGKTVTSCDRNVLTPLFNVISSMMSYKYVQSKNYIDITYNNKSNRFYVFGGKDEGSAALVQGVTLAGILFDEVALMPRSFVEQALARCSVDGRKFWFNCNPEHPLHWFYNEWILKSSEKKAIHLHFLMDDNPSLSKGMKEDYKTLFSGTFYERFILGLWVRAEGLIFPQFTKETHCIDTSKLEFISYILSCDYGIVNPFSCGLWGLCEGIWYRIDEYYYNSRTEPEQLTDGEHYENVLKLVGDRTIRKMIIDPSAASFIQLVRKKGKFNILQANNDVAYGIAKTREALLLKKVMFDNKCHNSIKEFQTYKWNDKADKDVPIKEFDHAMDEIRYFVVSEIKSRPLGIVQTNNNLKSFINYGRK